MNIAVFTPIAVYGWQGKRPPNWLIIASIVYAAGLLVMDVNTLLEQNGPEASGDAGARIPTISPRAPRLAGGARVPPFSQIRRYGVNRV